MILITGAAGKTGKAILRALARRGETVRALVRRNGQAAAALAMGAREAVAGDLRDQADLRRAMDGVRAVYHICPNASPDEVAIGRAAISAARAAGLEHFVYHSLLHPQVEAMPHHWRKLRVEEELFESGLPFTILQPAPYMQNLLAGWDSIAAYGVYAVPYAVETRLSLVDLEDVAEAAARVLAEPVHMGATYELAGTPAMSQVEVAGALSQQLGREVRAEVLSHDVWGQRARAAGLGQDQVETLLAMFRYYERCGLSGNSNVLSWLLGRPPTGFTAFVARVAGERQAA